MEYFGYHLDEELMPKHVAIIMDGNGRWAKKKKRPRLFGHRSAIKTVHDTVEFASDIGIEVLTLYAFSTENWKRSDEEVSGLMNLILEFLEKQLLELVEKNVHLRILGDQSRLPEKVVKAVSNAVEQTKFNDGLNLNIALNYGGRDELLRAIKNMIADGCKPEAITEEAVSGYLYTAGQPDPDLIIRTSGEKRLSNFLLWQCAYSEFIFDDVLWPDFDNETFVRLLVEYQKRDRRYGGAK